MKAFSRTNRPIPGREGQQGAVLVMAMMIVMIGSMAMTGWIVLLGARGLYTEQQLSSVQRRIAEANARALTREYLLENVVAYSSGDGGTYAPGTGPSWGQASIPEWTSPAMRSFEFPAGNNLISPAGGYSYAQTLMSGLSDGAYTSTYKAYVNSRSPLLGGDLLVVHAPFDTAVSVTGSLDVRGRAVLFAPGLPNSYSFTADDFAVPPGTTGFSLKKSNGTWLAGSNFPLVPETAGPSGMDLGYDGNLAVIDNPDNPGNSLYTKLTDGSFSSIVVSGSTRTNSRGIVSDGTGNVAVTLGDPYLTNLIITDAAKVTLEGRYSEIALRDAELLPAFMMLVLQRGAGRDLTTVSLQKNSRRRIHLAILKEQSHTPVQFDFTSELSHTEWRLMATLEGTPVVFNKSSGGVVSVKGGIRTNGSVTVVPGTEVVLNREDDPKLLNRLADRRAWVELYK